MYNPISIFFGNITKRNNNRPDDSRNLASFNIASGAQYKILYWEINKPSIYVQKKKREGLGVAWHEPMTWWKGGKKESRLCILCQTMLTSINSPNLIYIWSSSKFKRGICRKPEDRILLGWGGSYIKEDGGLKPINPGVSHCWLNWLSRHENPSADKFPETVEPLIFLVVMPVSSIWLDLKTLFCLYLSKRIPIISLVLSAVIFTFCCRGSRGHKHPLFFNQPADCPQTWPFVLHSILCTSYAQTFKHLGASMIFIGYHCWRNAQNGAGSRDNIHLRMFVNWSPTVSIPCS